MNNAGLTTTFEEGDRGQFELFKKLEVQKTKHMSTTDWVSFIKEGNGKFFSLEDVTNKIKEMR